MYVVESKKQRGHENICTIAYVVSKIDKNQITKSGTRVILCVCIFPINKMYLSPSIYIFTDI